MDIFYDGWGGDSFFFRHRGLTWGTVQVGFDGLGEPSYFPTIGG
jgi:hypothetical protein